jgi:hypothetical protein
MDVPGTKTWNLNFMFVFRYQSTEFFFFPSWLYSPWRTLAASHIGGFLNYLDILQVSLDEWSARRKASTYTGQHNTERLGTNIHALSGIRTHDRSNQPAKDPRLRPHGHCDRPL